MAMGQGGRFLGLARRYGMKCGEMYEVNTVSRSNNIINIRVYIRRVGFATLSST